MADPTGYWLEQIRREAAEEMRVKTILGCVELIRLIGKDWLADGDQIKFYAADYLADTIAKQKV